jgi:mannose-6-phosphate isomerase-like protein (cupin superfamily)
MIRVINKDELLSSDIGWEFDGSKYGGVNVSFLIIAAPPGSGPRLHSHPYDEIFIVQEGQVTFTVGDETLEASGGQIVIVPADTPHQFVNSGPDLLRQVDIHLSPRFITNWLT